MRCYRYLCIQYRPTPIAVLQRRHQNAATNAARVLSTEAGKVPAVGVDTYSTHQFAKADETRVIEPAFSEDEDDEEEAILMEIFQKGKIHHKVNSCLQN